MPLHLDLSWTRTTTGAALLQGFGPGLPPGPGSGLAGTATGPELRRRHFLGCSDDNAGHFCGRRCASTCSAMGGIARPSTLGPSGMPVDGRWFSTLPKFVSERPCLNPTKRPVHRQPLSKRCSISLPQQKAGPSLTMKWDWFSSDRSARSHTDCEQKADFATNGETY